LSIGPTLVDTASQRSHARLTLAPPTPVGRQFITLGGPVPDISRLKLLNLEGVVGLHCDAIVLLKHIDPPELDSVLRRAPDPAVPIVDFCGNHSIRRDFIGSHLNDESALEMQKHLAPVWARLAELPFQSNQEGPGLTLLRLVYSRDTPAKATFDPGYPLTVNYPLVGAGGGTRDPDAAEPIWPRQGSSITIAAVAKNRSHVSFRTIFSCARNAAANCAT
jgi:hypothetical protein